jgi:hypothetical protein
MMRAMKRLTVLLALGALSAAAAGPNPSVHYVRFDDSQYIDTGIPARTGVKIELVAEWSNPNADNGIFGARIGDNRFYLIHVYEGKLAYGAGGFVKTSASIAANTAYTIVSDFADDRQTISLDGTTVWSGTDATGLSLANTTLYLGAVNYAGAKYNCAMKVYSARIWLDGELVRDYRPDLRDGVPGFYDAANGGVFVPSSSSHGFASVPRWTAGPPDAFIEWLDGSSDGGCGIDTLVPARSGLSFEGKMRWNYIDAQAGGREYNYLGAYRSRQNYLAPVHVVSNQLWLAYGNGNDYGTHKFFLTHAGGTPATATAGTDYAFSAVMSNGVQTLVWDGETVHSGTLAQTVDFADDIAVFAAGSWGGFSESAPARCYWLKIWRDGTLVRDLVPAVKNGEGVLYDRVDGLCLYSWSPLGPARLGPPLAAATKPMRFCEFVGSTGAQYIDTGIIGRSDTKVEATVEWRRVDEDATAIGSRSGNTRFYPIHCYNGLTYGYNNYFTVGTFVAGQKHFVESELFAGAQKITLDGVVKANGAQGAIDTNLSMYLFALHNGNSVGNYAKVRIYDLKIWQDGELVRDYVPVIADNGAPHLWDKVSKTLFGSATDTPFWDGGEPGDPFERPMMILIK